jgi:hypothetical protein
MKNQSYRYALLRYIIDRARMEPQNIGVIVQNDEGAVLRIIPEFIPLHPGKFDRNNYRQWREFFKEEVNGPPVRFFQPPRNAPEFLDYLRSRCVCSNFNLSATLAAEVQDSDLAEVAEHLYETLVLP